jgi:TRAP-type C4-dicarboxylate transport system permease small subunit
MGLERIGQNIEKCINATNKVFTAIAAFTLLLMMLLVAVDVIGRYILNRPITGSTDIIELMLVIMVFFTLAYTAGKKGHVSVDVVYIRLPKAIKMNLDIITYAASLFIVAIITWRMFLRAWESALADPGPATSMLLIPEAPFMLIAAFGAFLLFIQLLIQFFQLFAGARE